MLPGALPPDAEAALAALGFEPRRRLEAVGGCAAWRVVTFDGLSACTATVLPTGWADDRLDQRVEALTTLRHPHLVATYRLLTTPRGTRVVISAEEDGLGLEPLSQFRPRWEPGEVVTLIAPLADALAHLHGNGLLHGALGKGSVTIAADGRPLLGGLLPVPPAAATARDDVVALARLGLGLLGPEPTAARTALAAAAAAARGFEDAESLARACEQAGSARPIRLPPAEVLAARALGECARGERARGERVLRGRSSAAQVGKADRWRLRSRAAGEHRRPAEPRHSGRRRAGVGVGVGVLLLGAIWTGDSIPLLSRSSGANGSEQILAADARSSAGAGEVTPAGSASGPGTARADPAAASLSGPTTSEPVAAAEHLTRQRDAALEGADQQALAAVTVEGSPARQQDLGLLRRLIDGGVRIAGLRTEILELAGAGEPSLTGDGSWTARVALSSRVAAYREVTAEGEVVRQVPAGAPSRVVLVLRWVDGRWLVSEIEPANS